MSVADKCAHCMGLGLHDSGEYKGGNEFLNCKAQSSYLFKARYSNGGRREGSVKAWLYLILLTDTPTADIVTFQTPQLCPERPSAEARTPQCPHSLDLSPSSLLLLELCLPSSRL